MNVDELFAELDVSVSSLFVKDELFVDFKNSCKSKEIVLNIEEVTIGQLINNVVTGVSEVGLAVLSDEEFFSVQKSAEMRKLNLEVLASEAL